MNIASIVDVWKNAGNQAYYNQQAEVVKDAIENIIAARDEQNLRGAILLGLDTTTFPDLNKTGNPFYDKPSKSWNLVKCCTLSVAIQFEYTSAVNRRRTKEGKEADFAALPRKWGVHIPGTPFVEHTAKDTQLFRTYISVVCLGKPTVKYYSITPEFREVNENEIAAFKPPKYETRQGLDNELIYRDFACDSINHINYKGCYELRDILRESHGEGEKSVA